MNNAHIVTKQYNLPRLYTYTGHLHGLCNYIHDNEAMMLTLTKYWSISLTVTQSILAMTKELQVAITAVMDITTIWCQYSHIHVYICDLQPHSS